MPSFPVRLRVGKAGDKERRALAEPSHVRGQSPRPRASQAHAQGQHFCIRADGFLELPRLFTSPETFATIKNKKTDIIRSG